MQAAVIVDDDQSNAMLYAAIIERVLGREALTFPEPRGALRHLEAHNAPLVIVDFDLPGMDGVEFVRAARAMPDRGRMPIMMVTGDDEAGLKLRALHAGANLFLKKPVRNAELVTQIRHLTGWSQNRVIVGTVVSREREAI